LGLEEETASFSRVKPGVSFIWSPTDRFSFSFARFAPGVFPYAYNIPRPRFDDAVLARAVACGVERVVAHARLEPVSEGGRVLGRDDAARLGASPAERLERAIATDAWLSTIAAGSKRVTSVATYANYQLISQRGLGPGWVMLGDAFGFVDPMLSPGVYLALRSAELVADALAPFSKAGQAPSPAGLEAALRPYAARQTAMLTAWLDLVATLYDGRFGALM